jgi:hypothetical protein
MKAVATTTPATFNRSTFSATARAFDLLDFGQDHHDGAGHDGHGH